MIVVKMIVVKMIVVKVQTKDRSLSGARPVIPSDLMRSLDRGSTIFPHHPVWRALSSYVVGPENARLTFVQRLARENGWSEAHALRVFAEYRRFCFMAATSDNQLTPSDAVDQAWHLHLTYSRDYWERFCPDILGRPLHHGPTAGGDIERARFFEQYARTLKRYEEVFGVPPPLDIWPGAARRLLEDPRARRVHPRDGIVVPKPALWAIFVIAALVAMLHFVLW
ncbi:glycine-rich domain-containing protein [Sphingomonas sp. DT-207]|uniref:glycine-rich domain-containing protein n=1 Tax=Sphingomonas sp. DT-207 TaxID=3396167 RepID=UPI003F1ACAE8